LGGSLHTMKNYTEALVVGSKETELKVYAGKTKYIVMSWDQNARWSHNVKNWKGGKVQIFGNNLYK
jgi:hypothetical protein